MGDKITAQHIGMEEVRKWVERSGRDTALVLGGGPSIDGDFDLVMNGCDPWIVSVKQHGLIYLAQQGMASDACCFLERPGSAGQDGLRVALLMSPGLYLISPFDGWSHVRIDEPWWNGGFSSSLAVWFACAAGFERVLVGGMDCYQGVRKYWYDRPGYCHPSIHSSIDDNLSAWRPALERCPHSERIRAVSGPLVEVFGRWAP